MKAAFAAAILGLVLAAPAAADLSPFWQTIREEMIQYSTNACAGDAPSAVILSIISEFSSWKLSTVASRGL